MNKSHGQRLLDNTQGHLVEGFKDKEIKSVLPVDKFGAQIQIKSSSGQTKWMTIDDELLKAISANGKSLLAGKE